VKINWLARNAIRKFIMAKKIKICQFGENSPLK
jgi:hypothetical protein